MTEQKFDQWERQEEAREAREARALAGEADISTRMEALVNLAEDGMLLEHMPYDIQNDKQAVKIAVKSNGTSLQFASDDMKDDLNLVMMALENDPHAFQYASIQIKDDPASVAEASTESFSSLNYASKRLLADKEGILTTCESHNINQAVYPASFWTGGQSSSGRMVQVVIRSFASEEIRDLVGEGDPVEVLTKAIASEKLAAKLSNQLRPQIDPRQQSMKI